MKTSKIGVSACLLGVNCKYNGGNNLDFNVIDHLKGKEVVLICPEEMAGLPTPRIPSEIQDNGRVINEINEDVTAYFNEGKKKTLKKLKDNDCAEVILKDGSPSCGYSQIYDGHFSNNRIKGKGLTTRHLIKNGIKVKKIN